MRTTLERSEEENYTQNDLSENYTQNDPSENYSQNEWILELHLRRVKKKTTLETSANEPDLSNAIL